MLKIKDIRYGYKLEFPMPETRELFGSTKNLIQKNKKRMFSEKSRKSTKIIST